jgi:hypothetical protein
VKAVTCTGGRLTALFRDSTFLRQFPKDWIPGKPPQRGPRLPGMTRFGAGRGLFPGPGCRSPFGRGSGVACFGEASGLCGNRFCHPHLGPRLFPKDWIPGKPPQRGPRLPGMTRNTTWWTCFGLLSTFPPFHLSTFPHHSPPRAGEMAWVCHKGRPGVT